METVTVPNAVTRIQSRLNPSVLETINGVFAFHFKDTREKFTLDVRSPDGQGWLAGEASAHGLQPNFEVTLSSSDFAKLVFGELNPMAGMATGRMKMKGNIREALKLDRLLNS
jgi:putative sterol carrier protein